MPTASRFSRRQPLQQKQGFWRNIYYTNISNRRYFRLLLVALAFVAIIPPIYFHFSLKRFQQVCIYLCLTDLLSCNAVWVLICIKMDVRISFIVQFRSVQLIWKFRIIMEHLNDVIHCIFWPLKIAKVVQCKRKNTVFDLSSVVHCDWADEG